MFIMCSLRGFSYQILLILSTTAFQVHCSSCGCDDEALCRSQPVQSNGFGFYGFTTDQSPATYTTFDWTKLSTVIVTGVTPQLQGLVCYAKARNVRVTMLSTIPVDTLQTTQKVDAYIQNLVKSVKDNNLDGVNMDFESNIAVNSPAYNNLTLAMMKLRTALRKADSNYSLSMDYVFCAQCIVGRTYDYMKIKDFIDYFILMMYDMQGTDGTGYQRVQGTDYCKILSNSPFPIVYKYAEEFVALGVPPSKLVLAFPWYGYQDSCELFDHKMQTCYTNCTNKDNGALQRTFSNIMSDLRQRSGEGRQWNTETLTPSLSIIASNAMVYQTNYDDPWSLRIKYEYVLKRQFRGSGTWTLNSAGNGNSTQTRADREMMWSVVPMTKK